MSEFKRTIKQTVSILLILLSIVIVAQHKQTPNAPKKFTLKELYAVKEDATVMILRPFLSGSGFCIDKKYIVTNAHVVGFVDELLMIRNSKIKDVFGTAIWLDRAADLAVVYIPSGCPNYYKLATYIPEIGDEIFNIGSPRGMINTASKGNITGLLRTINTETGLKIAFIQFDSGISHGSSGSPVINDRGEVVAVVAVIGDGPNLGFGPAIQTYRDTILKIVEEHKSKWSKIDG